MIKSLNAEIGILRETVSELKDELAGVIHEKGCIVTDPVSGISHVEINDSSILSRLICEAGRYCNHYASDLFIIWKYSVDKKKESGTLESGTVVFAFRDNGVDSKNEFENKKDWQSYYRAIWELDILVEGSVVEMRLHKGGTR